MKTITIKLKKLGRKAGPFNIETEFKDIVASNVSKELLINGVSYNVEDNVTMITLSSTGECKYVKTVSLKDITIHTYINTIPTYTKTTSMWRHLTNIQIYNNFYNKIHPYIIEYPFSYQYQDEILQNVKDYTKAYEYLPIPDGVFNYNTKIETDDKWFNKAILYNGQQSSGILNLVPKVKNNLKSYNSFPKFNLDSKTIIYTKSDNFYQYNTFWALQKSSQETLFNTSCESLSIDKVINQANMDYSSRSFKKAPLKAKELKIRHILDSSSTTHLVSQFIIAPAQISYK